MTRTSSKSLDRIQSLLDQAIRDAKAAADKTRDVHASLLLLQIKLSGR